MTMDELEQAVARGIAPLAWTPDRPGVAPHSQAHRRTASLRHASKAIAAIEAAGIPLGKLVSGERVDVPREPTGAMQRKGAAAFGQNTGGFGEHDDMVIAGIVYRAMLAAKDSTDE